MYSNGDADADTDADTAADAGRGYPLKLHLCFQFT